MDSLFDDDYETHKDKNHKPKIQVKLGNSSAGKSKKTRPGIVSEDNWQAKYYLTCSI